MREKDSWKMEQQVQRPQGRILAPVIKEMQLTDDHSKGTDVERPHAVSGMVTGSWI